MQKVEMGATLDAPQHSDIVAPKETVKPTKPEYKDSNSIQPVNPLELSHGWTAKRLPEIAAGRCGYVPSMKGWAYYDGTVWQLPIGDNKPDKAVIGLIEHTLLHIMKYGQEMMGQAKEYWKAAKDYALAEWGSTVKMEKNGPRFIGDNPAGQVYLSEAYSNYAKDMKRGKEWVEYAKRSNRARDKAEIARDAANMDDFSFRRDMFDTHPYLFNASNGTLDVKTGELRDHDLYDFLSVKSPVEYNPEATAPRWYKFLNEITCEDQDLILYLQKAAGLSLTGDTSAQVMFNAYGKGANGKSVFMNILQDVAGPYAQEISPSVLMRHKAKGGEGPTDGLAQLAGIRLATANETQEGRALDEATVKQITGNDRIRARHLNQSSFEYRPQFTLWLRSNHLSGVTSTDDGIWRRLKVIPFDAKFTGQNCDPYIYGKLKTELSGILNWAIEGYRLYQQQGLYPEPERVAKAVKDYQNEQNPILEYLRTQPQGFRAELHGVFKASELLRHYNDWAKDCEEPKFNATQFGRRLANYGMEKKHTRDGIQWIVTPEFLSKLREDS